jgi:hypothetical protein
VLLAAPRRGRLCVLKTPNRGGFASLAVPRARRATSGEGKGVQSCTRRKRGTRSATGRDEATNSRSRSSVVTTPTR